MTLVVQIIARCNSIVRQRKWKLETFTYSVTPPDNTTPSYPNGRRPVHVRSGASRCCESRSRVAGEVSSGGGDGVGVVVKFIIFPTETYVHLLLCHLQAIPPRPPPQPTSPWVQPAEVCTFYDEKTSSS